MPLHSVAHGRRVYDRGIKPALESLKFFPSRIDIQSKSESIGASLRSEIASAYFCVADLSFARPNCYYEIGYAHAIGKRVLLLKDSVTDAHFDLSDYQQHQFSAKSNVAALIKSIIPEFLASQKREEDDLNNQRFGRLPIRDGFRLCAEVIGYEEKTFYLNLEVASLVEQRKLHGKVKFYLHDTYKKSIQSIAWRGRKAVYEDVQTDGPYTVGAEIEMTGTKLELDLATIPCRYKRWKNTYRVVDGLVTE